MNELRIRGFKFILETIQYHYSSLTQSIQPVDIKKYHKDTHNQKITNKTEKKQSFALDLTDHIKFLQDSISPVVDDIYQKSKLLEPRISLISPSDLGLILLEVMNQKYQIETMSKLFPEIDKFTHQDGNSISGFVNSNGVAYKFLKVCNLASSNPLKQID